MCKQDLITHFPMIVVACMSLPSAVLNIWTSWLNLQRTRLEQAKLQAIGPPLVLPPAKQVRRKRRKKDRR